MARKGHKGFKVKGVSMETKSTHHKKGGKRRGRKGHGKKR